MERHLVAAVWLVLATVISPAEANTGTILADGTMACERLCDKDCPNGFLSDSCPRCTCAPDPCEFRSCASGTVCRKIETDCGFSRGCPMTAVCESQTSPVCQSTCAKQCDWGYEAVGCPRCTCSADPCLSAQCPSGTQCMTKPTSCKFKTFCPHFAMCMSRPCAAVSTTECRYGLLPIGCPRSKCAADPCLSTRCPDGRACKAVVSNCSFGTECPYVGICEQTLCAETMNKVCAFGFKMRGCPRSECASDPCLTKVCQEGYSCFLQNGSCPFSDHCPLEAVCQPSACEKTLNINCPYGFKSQGCPRNECAENPCSLNLCNSDEECFAKHVNCGFTSGCPYETECRPKVCGQVISNLRCDYGFQLSGCPRNKCSRNPCLDDLCPAGKTCVTSPANCTYGFECPHTYQCVDTVCTNVTSTNCAFGVEETGCPRTLCAIDPCVLQRGLCANGQTCTSRPTLCRSGVSCPHEAACVQDVCADVAPNVQCTFGFEMIGCPRVQCAPNPCDRANCRANQTCVAEPADCKMGTNCPFEYQCRDNNCAEVKPNIRCEFGFVLEGCPREKCVPNPCDVGPRCPSNHSCFAEKSDCAYGIECPYEKRCVPNDCADVMPIVCNFGILEKGCPRNECALDPCRTRICSQGKVCRTQPSQCRSGNSCPHIAICVDNDCPDVGLNICRFGVLEKGCPRTTCAPDPCDTKICPVGFTCATKPSSCKFGFQCPHEAFCSTSDCAEVAPNIQCSFGFTTTGCPRSQCARNPCDGTRCPAGQSCVAEPSSCSLGIQCPYEARCQANDCKNVMPNMKCPFGILPTGCPRSTCAPNPCDSGFPCPPGQSCYTERGNCSQEIECPFVRKCVSDDCPETMPISCKFGIREIGCPRSRCAVDPCVLRNCGSGQKCTTRPSQCRSRIDCPHEAQCVDRDCAQTSSITCRFGFLEKGCPRSQCAPDPCRTRICSQGKVCTTEPSTQCRFGNDCPHTARCTDSVCSEVADNVQCAFGFLSVGCPRFQCAPNPCDGVTCPAGQNCMAVEDQCALGIKCPYKHECRPANCSEILPNMRCDFGALTNGCPRSTCAPNPCAGSPCRPNERCFAERGQCAFRNECPYVRICVPKDCGEVLLSVTCDYGVLEIGCPRSTCAPNPCFASNCSAGSVCTSTAGDCKYGNDCPHQAVCAERNCGRVSNIFCPFGVLERGCPRSTCAPDPCQNKTCGTFEKCSSRPTACQFGNECPHEASCVASDCPEVAQVTCSYGVLERGCPRSTCAPNPCEEANCGPTKFCTTRPRVCRSLQSCPHEAVCLDKDCPQVAPNVRCPYGFSLTGCPRRTCAPNPCDNNNCGDDQDCVVEPGDCRFGIECPFVSKCVLKDCAEVMALSCPYGVQLTGCPRDKCAPNPCLRRICSSGQQCVTNPSSCAFGIECPHEANCVDSDCANVLSSLSCVFGVLETGCPRDTCAPDPCVNTTCLARQTCRTAATQCLSGIDCPHEAFCTDSVCEQVVSNVQCPFGFMSIGCPRTSCAPNPCNGVRCARGETCTAVHGPCEFNSNCPYVSSCQAIDCADILQNIRCDYGFLMTGCPRSTCAPNPCDNNNCGADQKCVVEPGDCRFGIECPFVSKCVLKDCAEVMALSCPYGVQLTGCPRDKCAPNPCLRRICSSGQQCVTNPSSCAFGIECPHEANCVDSDCANVLSSLSCVFGVLETGCPRDTCAPDPCVNTTCLARQTCRTAATQCLSGIDCPHEAFCTDSVCEQVVSNVQCPFGFMSIGCPRTSCAPNPCNGVRCARGETCTAVHGPCEFNSNCPYVSSCQASDCADILQNIRCDYGFLMTGCPRSTCAPNPCDNNNCGADQKCVVEPGDCRFGIECPFVSKCVLKDCAEVMALSCPYGVQLTGCPRDKCAPNPCLRRICSSGQQCVTNPSSCAFGIECPHEANCVDSDCANVLSSLSCVFGVLETGCPRDTCAPDPCVNTTCLARQTCRTAATQCLSGIDCPHEAFCTDSVCEQVVSNVQCPFGFMSIGCPRSSCAPNPCNGVRCARGETCTAVHGPCEFNSNCPYVSSCQAIDCADILQNIRCDYGFLMTGCPRSTCAPNPCDNNNCGADQKCVVEPGDCRFGIECPFVSKCVLKDCAEVMPLSCPYGVQLTGCPRDKCAPNPCLRRICSSGQQCVTNPSSCAFGIECPHEANCVDSDCANVLSSLSCLFGVLETGCPRDTCAPDPCVNTTCLARQTCRTAATQCLSGIDCPHDAFCTDSVCEQVVSNVQCPFGFMSIGCPRSSCAPNPCNGVRCARGETCTAVHGPCEFNSNCPYVSSCQASDCADILQNIRCDYGFLMTGCPRSTCAPNPCDGVRCKTGEKCITERGQCDHGIQCPYVHKCVNVDCADVRPISCPFGILEKGCPRDSCAPDPCLTRTCGVGRTCVTRASICRFANDCPHEALCLDNVCREVASNLQCSFGFLSIGCPRSQCAPNPCSNITCRANQFCRAEPGTCDLEVNCPFVGTCSDNVCEKTVQMFCPYGFENIGCPRRVCAPNPCLNRRCLPDEKCFTKPGICRFTGHCPFVAECRPRVCENTLPLHCDFGFKNIGCPRSECAENPCRNITCGSTSLCYAKNETCEFNGGCPFAAECRPSVCAETLSLNCPFGFKMIGCPRSQCAEDPCLNNNCSASQSCFLRNSTCGFGTGCPMESYCAEAACAKTLTMNCPYGFEPLGCPRSVCAQDPCLTVRCNPNEVCTTQPTLCSFQTYCPHQAVCKPSLCAETLSLNCPFGFKMIGCPRSQCAEDPCLNNNCSASESCFLRRSSACGFDTGCPMESYCAETVCAKTLTMNCPYGFEPLGCPRSVCAQDPCLTVRCNPNEVCTTQPTLCRFQTYCPHQAVCKPSLCERVCSKICPFGFKMEGCPRCECSPDPCETSQCDAGLTCKTRPSACEFNEGCPHVATCDNTACEATCKKLCEFGFEPVGCPRCECKPDPCQGVTCTDGKTCQPIVPPCEFNTGCPAIASCDDFLCSSTCTTKECPFGFEMSGCPRCTCVQDPCTNHSCPTGSVCETEPGTCVLNNKCPYHAVCKAPKCTLTCSFRTCPFGFLESGCPRCNCAPNPCVGFNCATGQKCVAVESSCVSSVACPKTAACMAVDAVDPCTLPRSRGPCQEAYSSYFFDTTTKTCKWFPYSGCGGNANRFDTWYQCMKACNTNGALTGIRRDFQN